MVGVLFILLITCMTGVLIAFHRDSSKQNTDHLALLINTRLPQTQCGKCGYPGCLPYAQAISEGKAEINQCPPGGYSLIKNLANLLGHEPKPLNTKYGTVTPQQVALIDEEICIGCVKCIRACPVDAIVGAPKQMHTVIINECTGCELCIAPCPVECISLVPVIPWR